MVALQTPDHSYGGPTQSLLFSDFRGPSSFNRFPTGPVNTPGHSPPCLCHFKSEAACVHLLSSPSSRKPRAAVSSLIQGTLLSFIQSNIVLASILVGGSTLLVYIQKQIKSPSPFLTNCHKAKSPFFCHCVVNHVNLILVTFCLFLSNHFSYQDIFEF